MVADKAWVVVTYALLFFSFSSGYFTSMRYGVKFDVKKYWKNKLARIGVEYTLLNIFLVVLFLIQGQQNIFSFQSLLCWVGLKGFMTWFGIPNHSHFGAGLWFLTLLIIFYISYPAIAYACQKKIGGWVFLLVSIAILLYCDATIHYNHMLWITACGFILGVFFNSRAIILSVKMCVIVIFVEIALIAIAYLYGINIGTGRIVLMTSIPLFYTAFHFELPDLIQKAIYPLRGAVLGIYILQLYTSMHPTGKFLPDYVLSVVVTVFIAYIINRVSTNISNKLLPRN